MQFDSLSDFVAMGGYAFYVWSSFGITAVVLAWNIVAPLYKLRRVRERLAREQRLGALSDSGSGTGRAAASLVSD